MAGVSRYVSAHRFGRPLGLALALAPAVVSHGPSAGAGASLDVDAHAACSFSWMVIWEEGNRCDPRVLGNGFMRASFLEMLRAAGVLPAG